MFKFILLILLTVSCTNEVSEQYKIEQLNICTEELELQYSDDHTITYEELTAMEIECHEALGYKY